MLRATMDVLLMALLFLIVPDSSHGKCPDTNTTFQNNQKTIRDLLIKNTPLHDGFYNSSVGNNSDQVYGVFQCKPNISSNVCANCLKSSLVSDECFESPEMETMSSFCTTKISNKNIFGVWSNSSTASFGNKGLDDPVVFSKGFSMMQDLKSTVPYQPLMYKAAEIDVGVDGKRYGLAQCGRDLSKLNCQNCLEDRLLGYRSYVENRTGWEILGSSCSMWYSNVSDAYKSLDVNTVPADNQFPPGTTSVTSGTQRYHGGIGLGICIWVSTFTIILATHFSICHE